VVYLRDLGSSNDVLPQPDQLAEQSELANGLAQKVAGQDALAAAVEARLTKQAYHSGLVAALDHMLYTGVEMACQPQCPDRWGNRSLIGEETTHEDRNLLTMAAVADLGRYEGHKEACHTEEQSAKDEDPA
jgi:hypothetical protein